MLIICAPRQLVRTLIIRTLIKLWRALIICTLTIAACHLFRTQSELVRAQIIRALIELVRVLMFLTLIKLLRVLIIRTLTGCQPSMTPRQLWPHWLKRLSLRETKVQCQKIKKQTKALQANRQYTDGPCTNNLYTD